MNRLAKITGGLLLMGVGMSCNPFKFDDLKDEAWVQIEEKDDTKNAGDFGTDVIAAPPPAEGGARFIVAVSAPPGMAQITLDASGSVTDHVGFNGELNGRGALEPLDNRESPTGLALFNDTQFLTGVKGRDMVIRYDVGLSDGLAILPTAGGTAPDGSGLALTAGNLGLGAATNDVVAVATTAITVITDGDGTKRATCNMKAPNAANAPPVQVQSVAIAPVKGGANGQIVVSTSALDNSPHVLILDGSQVVDGQDCPIASGFDTPAGQPPVAIAVGNLDSNPALEIVTGTVGAGGGASGRLRVYMNVNGTTPASAMDVPLGAKDEDPDADKFATAAHASRIIIANIDGDPGNEIIVADPGAQVDGVSAAGRVLIYRMGGTCDPDDTRGPLCLVRTLFDPSPEKNDYFGRAMAVGQFKSGSGTAPVLALTQRGKLWVYFRVFESQTDPRQ